jgi:hypothetical protein
LLLVGAEDSFFAFAIAERDSVSNLRESASPERCVDYPTASGFGWKPSATALTSVSVSMDANTAAWDLRSETDGRC